MISRSDTYGNLEREERKPRAIRDHSEAWNRLRSIEDVNGDAQAALARFCERKRITVGSLVKLGARLRNGGDVGWCLAYAGTNGNGTITAVKYRPLNGTSHHSFAERPSVWLRPIIAGNLGSLSWLVVEGETDAARLHELAGDQCAIMVLPAGAKTFKREWADLIPRGATVALCLDADDDGDAGAEKAAKIVGGRTVRVRPPVEGGDWCDWDGDREQFLALVATARTQSPSIAFLPSDELLSNAPDQPAWIWEGGLTPGAVSLSAGKPKVGKSTLLYGLVEAIANRQGEFLGREIVGGPVVYASEEGYATLGPNFPKHPDIYLLTREGAWPKPPWTDLVIAACEKAREVGAVVVVVDTFSYFNGLGADSEKDAGSVQGLLDTFSGEITRTEAAGLVNHHHRKSGGEDGDAVRGSGAIIGAIDCFWEVERVEDAPANQRRLVITPRWPAPPVLLFEWDEVFGYKIIGEAASRDESGKFAKREQVLAAIPVEPSSIDRRDLEEALGDRRDWFGTITALISEGVVEVAGKGVRGDPLRYSRKAGGETGISPTPESTRKTDFVSGGIPVGNPQNTIFSVTGDGGSEPHTTNGESPAVDLMAEAAARHERRTTDEAKRREKRFAGRRI